MSADETLSTTPERTARRRRLRRQLLAAAGFAVLVAALFLPTASSGVVAQPDRVGELTAQQVIAAFEAEGLPVEQPRRDQVGGSPSGPPTTEREAWSFTIPSVAPSGGRILVFGPEERRRQKVAWFNRAGAGNRITVHGNVVLWLDEDLEPREAARYRQALRELGR